MSYHDEMSCHDEVSYHDNDVVLNTDVILNIDVRNGETRMSRLDTILIILEFFLRLFKTQHAFLKFPNFDHFVGNEVWKERENERFRVD